MSYILVQKSVWRSSESRVGLASKRQVWSILFFFEIYDHVSKGKFGPLSNCSKRKVWSRFGEKFGPKLPFLNNLNHVWEMFWKRQVWSRFFSESGPNLPFRTIWKWTKLAFWHVIINFEKKKKWTKPAFSKQILTWFWTPSNTFLDQNIRQYVLSLWISCHFRTIRIISLNMWSRGRCLLHRLLSFMQDIDCKNMLCRFEITWTPLDKISEVFTSKMM